MKVYEVAKSMKIKSKELIKLIGDPRVDHHLDTIPDDILETLEVEEKKIETPEPERTQTVDSAKTDVVDVEIEEVPAKSECPYTIQEIKLGIRCLGGNAPQYKWRHLIG